jgi:hypothetical protein
VIEQAMELAARMLGSDKSRGYCLEMICADFLAGVSLQQDDQQAVTNALYRCFCLLPGAQQTNFLECLNVMVGNVNSAGHGSSYRVIISKRGRSSGRPNTAQSAG